MFFTLLRQWVITPVENYRLFHHFTRQDFVAQFAASIGGILWLFVTPIAHIVIYAFVFGYIFQLRALPEFGQTEFVIFMMIGYLPWFAFAEAVGKSPGLLLEKAGLITKVLFPVQVIPVVGTVVPYLTHVIGFCLLLVYLAMQGYFSLLWLWLPVIFFPAVFVHPRAGCSVVSSLCVFARLAANCVALGNYLVFFNPHYLSDYPYSKRRRAGAVHA